jgi:hypothetical protein
MAYFQDLSPYAYGHRGHPAVVHVGWLDSTHPFRKGAVESRLIEKMKLLSRTPVELYRGKHFCDLCTEPPNLEKTFTSKAPGLVRYIDPNCSWARWMDQRSSNGEIRVRYGELTFAAPLLIVHYIEEHGYLPPAEFLKAIEETVC